MLEVRCKLFTDRNSMIPFIFLQWKLWNTSKYGPTSTFDNVVRLNSSQFPWLPEVLRRSMAKIARISTQLSGKFNRRQRKCERTERHRRPRWYNACFLSAPVVPAEVLPASFHRACPWHNHQRCVYFRRARSKVAELCVLVVFCKAAFDFIKDYICGCYASLRIMKWTRSCDICEPIEIVLNIPENMITERIVFRLYGQKILRLLSY